MERELLPFEIDCITTVIRKIVCGGKSRKTFRITNYQHFWCFARCINISSRKQIRHCGRRTRKFHKHFLIYYNNYIIVFYFCQIKWRRKWDSNSQPELYKGPALAVGAIPPYGRDGANWTLINRVSDDFPTFERRLHKPVSSTTGNSSRHYFTSIERLKSYIWMVLSMRLELISLPWEGSHLFLLVRWEHKTGDYSCLHWPSPTVYVDSYFISLFYDLVMWVGFEPNTLNLERVATSPIRLPHHRE